MDPSSPTDGHGSLRVYFDDDDGSYFDLNVDRVDSDFRFELPVDLPGGHGRQSPTLLPPEPPTRPREEPPQRSPEPSAPGPAAAPRRSIKLWSRAASRRGAVFSSSRSHDEAAASAMKARGLEVESSTPNSRSTAAIITSGMVKLLIKFPSEKIRMAFLSMARSRQRPSVPTPDPIAIRTTGRRRRPLYRNLVVVPLRKIFASRRSAHNVDGRPKIVDIGSKHSNILKAVMDAMTVESDDGSKGRGYNRNRARSAPTSPLSSPRRSSAYSTEEEMKMWKKVVERESSISSAIAHCKGVVDP